MSVPSTPENSSSYLLEATVWTLSLHSRGIAFFAKPNNYPGMKPPYSGVTGSASAELSNDVVMQDSFPHKSE